VDVVFRSCPNCCDPYQPIENGKWVELPGRTPPPQFTLSTPKKGDIARIVPRIDIQRSVDIDGDTEYVCCSMDTV
jgi:hypothetical protein